MISIKKYMDGPRPAIAAEPQRDPLLEVALDCYASALRTVGRSALEACLATGRELDEGLAALLPRLGPSSTPQTLQAIQSEAERHLASWGAHTAEHLKGKADEVRELMLMLAGTAESVGERDQRYANQFTGLTADLHAVANLEDITQVRRSVLKKAAEMKICVDAMAEDGRQSLNEMRAKLSGYEEKLRQAEELATKDPLTGVANRRGLEARMAWWARQHRSFCVVMLDLNKFKELNDRHGHQAGDDLLRAFAGELTTRIRADDMVGRWGGDEFVVVIGCGLEIAQRQVDRIRQWVFGEYALRTARGRSHDAPLKVHVEAALGLAEWIPGETLEELLKRADAAMYQDKATARKMTA